MKTLYNIVKHFVLVGLLVSIHSIITAQGHHNYIKNIYVHTPGIKTINQISSAKTNKSVTYFDEFGRTSQIISSEATPNGGDIVQPIKYDPAGNQSRIYLPYVEKDGTGNYRDNAETNQSLYYLNGIQIAHSSVPFSDVKFEESPLNRVLETSAPGYSWRMAGGNTTLYGYSFNTSSDAVRKWIINSDNSVQSTNTYSPNELFVTELQDENHNQFQKGFHSYSFVDKSGKQVLKKEILSESISYYTYYVYDDFGNLRFIIPPKAIEIMATSGWNSNSLGSQDLIYWFKYDRKQRLVKRKIPGKLEEIFIYNNRNQLISYQDGNLRASNKWINSEYDVYGRLIRKGVLINTSTATALQDFMDSYTGSLYEDIDDSPQSDGYTDLAFPVYSNYPGSTIYNYYAFDKYPSWLTSSFLFKNHPDFPQQSFNRLFGKLTAEKHRSLESSGFWLTSAFYYDDKGRVIQTVSDNQRGKLDVVFIKYSLSNNQIEKTLTIHNYNASDQVKVQDRFTYLDNGQIKEVYRKVNEQTEVLAEQNIYNELLQMVQKKIHSVDGGVKFLQTVDYRYNIRGWLSNINNSNLFNDNWFVKNEANIALDETVTDLIIDTINLGIKVYFDGKRTSAQLSINDSKKLRVCKINNPSDSRLIPIDENLNSEFFNDDPYQVDVFNRLSPADGTQYKINLGGVPFDQYSETQEFIDTIAQMVNQKLAAQNVAEIVRTELVAQVITYIASRTSIVYFNNNTDDLFGLDIVYDQLLGGLNTQKQFNGNISGIRWQTSTNKGERAYGYSYDRMNRMTAAKYATRTSTGWTGDVDRYSLSAISFDANGNITSLKRNGSTDFNGSTYSWGLMDNLTYTYSGNRLTAVEDAIGKGTPTNALPDFKDRSSTGTNEYGYDANGNLTRDDNKGITNIVYNFLNKPSLIQFGINRKIEYFYDANGTKLTKKVTIVNGQTTTTTRTDYIGGFIYTDNVLSSVSLSNGRLVKKTDGSFDQQYYLKDHLGNVRVVFGADSQGKVVALQEDSYYPYGMTMSGLSIVSTLANNNKYQGKEYQSEGFDTDNNNTLDTYLAWYDFDARFFDPQLGRWHVPDPANQYASPYVGMGNNPANGIDPDGRKFVTIYQYWMHFQLMFDGITKWNISYSYEEVGVRYIMEDVDMMGSDIRQDVITGSGGGGGGGLGKSRTNKIKKEDEINKKSLKNPVVYVSFRANPKGLNRAEFMHQLKERLIDNGVTEKVEVLEHDWLDELIKMIFGEPYALLTIKDYARGDEMDRFVGGFAEKCSMEAVVYNGLIRFGEKGEVPVWLYVHVALHELGHAIWGFSDVGFKGNTNNIMDYSSSNNPNAFFQQIHYLMIKNSIWGR